MTVPISSLVRQSINTIVWTVVSVAVCTLPLGCNRTGSDDDALSYSESDPRFPASLDRVLRSISVDRHLSITDHGAWDIVHGMLAFGREFQIYDNEKREVPALDWLLMGGELRGWTIRRSSHGLDMVVAPGSRIDQGHEDQWLGYLSQAGVSADERIIVDGDRYTIRDLIRQAQWDVHEGMDASWTLMAFSAYLPLDTEWLAKDGSKWTIERIVHMLSFRELADSPCGGTHCLYSLTVARNRYVAEGGSLAENPSNAWQAADEKIRRAIAKAKAFQQSDGSLSTNFFVRPAASADIGVRISTTGHMLEFLVAALADHELNAPWITRAVGQLVECLERAPAGEVECGALYHAARAVKLYRIRRFGPHDTSAAQEHSSPSSALPSRR